jgi:hypothetical protein
VTEAERALRETARRIAAEAPAASPELKNRLRLLLHPERRDRGVQRRDVRAA